MNIRPVDLQILIPKSTEVGKTQAAMNQQSLLQQQYSAEKNQKLADQRLHQVQKTFGGEGGKIQRDENFRDKQGGHQQDAYEQKHKPPEPDHLEQSKIVDKDGLRGQVIDIKT
jgi:hypothetical protein